VKITKKNSKSNFATTKLLIYAAHNLLKISRNLHS